MNLFTQKELSQWDEITLNNQNITDIELIDRATESFLGQFFSVIEGDKLEYPIICLCGVGNNGADGIAIATKLFHRGYPVVLWDVDIQKQRSTANDHYRNHLPSEVEVLHINPEKEYDLPEISPDSIMIDAMFGIGLHGTLSSDYFDLIDGINNYSNYKVAVDIPSGMYADLKEAEIAIISDLCLTFETPKLSFFLEENLYYCDTWFIIDIGLDSQYFYESEKRYSYYSIVDASLDLPLRDLSSHKHEYGHVLVCSGSMGKIGSAILSAKATLRSGCGLVTIHSPECAVKILQISIPEAMVSQDPSLQTISELPNLDPYNVISIGPGLGRSQKAKEFLLQLLDEYKGYIVLDADALNILSTINNWQTLIDERHILLPHAGEFDRLFGSSNSHLDRIQKIQAFIEDYDATIALKGPCTIVARQNYGISFNSNGNPGMATAGSGDVLTGIVSSIMAQLEDPYYATRLAVYIHGLAGDNYAYQQSQESLIASDIISYLGSAFKTIKNVTNL